MLNVFLKYLNVIVSYLIIISPPQNLCIAAAYRPVQELLEEEKKVGEMLSQVRSEDSTYILISISIWGQAELHVRMNLTV